MVGDAVRMRASDIHIEPRKSSLEVRMRVDGVMQLWKELPKDLQDTVASRIKVLSDLDINEKRLPQDGRISFSVDGKGFDVRISTLPVLYGEKVVMRLLDRSMSIRGLNELDFVRHNAETFMDLIHRPLGLVLVTGPTGSGKTTTLYAALNALRSPTVNLVTCEDPVEIDLPGVNQSSVNERVGLTFARQLRAILRQDPDIVLVGEMRDSETAEIAFRAAMTGHLVLSTLHSNDAPTSVTRLLDMGVPPFLIASGLIGMVAQRLVRRLCASCRALSASMAPRHSPPMLTRRLESRTRKRRITAPLPSTARASSQSSSPSATSRRVWVQLSCGQARTRSSFKMSWSGLVARFSGAAWLCTWTSRSVAPS
jgi:type IV pilus assembly protein PilB